MLNFKDFIKAFDKIEKVLGVSNMIPSYDLIVSKKDDPNHHISGTMPHIDVGENITII